MSRDASTKMGSEGAIVTAVSFPGLMVMQRRMWFSTCFNSVSRATSVVALKFKARQKARQAVCKKKHNSEICKVG